MRNVERPLITTEQDTATKLLFIGVVLVAFIDGILVTAHFYEKSNASAMFVQSGQIIEENPFEFRSQSTTQELDGEDERAPQFLVQAPLGTWDKPWDEYAEEAAAFMAVQNLKGEDLPSERGEQAEALRAIGRWENEAWGYSTQTDLFQTKRFIQEYLFWEHVQIVELPAAEQMVEILKSGALILAPVNGQILDNPYYGDPAPLQHMILIHGVFEENGEHIFVAHDPGTIRGENTQYSQTKILQSLQDLDGSKRILILYPTKLF